MNKRGILDDWTDVVMSLIIAMLMLFIFSFALNSEEVKIDLLVEDTSNELKDNLFLMQYLKTPVKSTDINIRTLNPIVKRLAIYAIESDLTIADVAILADKTNAYFSLLERITESDKDYKSNNFVLKHSDGRDERINAGCSLGIAVSADLPTEDGIIKISMKKCK